MCSSEDVNITYRQFMIKFQELYDECIPKRVLKNAKQETLQRHRG